MWAWYLILATMREAATNRWARMVYGMLSLGWRGSARHWTRYEALYILLAGISTPLVLSVHTVVSFDFAIAIVPGWHTTIFPPYFVAGAIYSGFAMVLVLAIPIRKYYGSGRHDHHAPLAELGEDHAGDRTYRCLRLLLRGLCWALQRVDV